jgi:CheY-like chemotaxis protein
VSNISARMKLEEQRENLLEREKIARTSAEQHSQNKDDFIAVLSHELRTPLNAILMGLHLLLSKGGAPDTVKGLRMIERNAKAQARIISDILDVSRFNSGKLTLDRELIDAGSVVDCALEGMREAIDRRHLSVTLDVSTAHAPVWLDATRFQQIFWNIFSNAIKFSEPGGLIEVKLMRSGGALILAVRDYGKGIEPEFLKTIFDKFSQGSTAGNRFHGGLGLGMAIVKHLAELHGGSARVESDGLGKGANVTLEIPALSAPLSGEDVSLDSAKLDPDSSLTGITILVVEDEPQNREMLTMILRDRGARVVTAENYDEAIRRLESDRPHVLVSDIGLPGRDGYELVKELRRGEQQKALSRLPAIALTAFGRAQDVDSAIEAGFDAHLAKPLRTHDLVTRIAALTRR